MEFRQCPAAGLLPSGPIKTETPLSPKSMIRAPASPPTFKRKSSSCISPPRNPAPELAWRRLTRSCSGTTDQWISIPRKGREPHSACAGRWRRPVRCHLRKLPREAEKIPTKNMKRLITVAIFAGLLWLEIPSSAQDQPPAPSAPASPSTSPADGAQPQTEPVPAAPQPTAPASTEDKTPTPPPASPPSPAPKAEEKKSPATKASAPGHKVVVRNGGAKDESAQLAPGMSKEQELQSRQATTRLLAVTDANVKSVAGRQLTPAQQGMLDQIQTYMKQSRQASSSGDLARAHTLADKAHLLSDELRK